MTHSPNITDVIVIGGGVVGLASAYALAKESFSVVVLERGRCGQEASWAGAGVLQSGSWHRNDPLVQLQRESVRMHASFAAELRERTGIDPEFTNCGSLELLLEDQAYRMAASEVKAAEAHRAADGGPVLELLTAQEAREREPALTKEMLGAKRCPLTSQVRNPRLLQALQAACLAANVRIVEGAEVRAIERDGSRVSRVRTEGDAFSAGHVVLAAGSWSSQLDPQLDQLMPVYPVRGQIVLLEEHPRPFAHVIERGRCYLVPRLDGRIVAGATEEHDAGYEKRTTAEGIAGLLEIARRLVPQLGQATVERTWSGLRPGTPDRRPYLGPVPGWDGLYAAAGHFRSGLTLAPVTAQIIAHLITRGTTPHDLTGCEPGREAEESRSGR